VNVPDGVGPLFKLDWPGDPSLLEERRKAMGVQHYVAEIAAWCAEINEQLDALAADRGMPLVLMGGNAAALRLEVAMQRGSADNDYLTSASEQDIAGLMDAFAERFAAAPEPYFRPEAIPKPEGAEDLPVRAYKIRVPRISDHNPRADEHLVVKVEFHMDPELPPHERVSSEMWAVTEPVHANIPLLPFQVGLKLMTLVQPPVGIEPAREDSIPRQIYDVDVLLAQMLAPGNWKDLAAYGRRRYRRERTQRGLPGEDGQPWRDVIDRLDEWSACRDRTSRYWSLINAMQSAQLKRQSQRLPEEWAARCRRLSVAMRCLEHTDPYPSWERIIEIERRIPTNPQGAELRALRRAITQVAEDVPPATRLRSMYWEWLGSAPNLDAALERAEAIARALPA